MLTVVLILNCLIALLCLYAAWKIWKLRLSLSKAADVLISAERSTHAVLYGAPDAILKGQLGMNQLRQKYQQLQPQLRRAQQALVLVSLGQRLWQSRSPKVMARKLLRRGQRRRVARRK